MDQPEKSRLVTQRSESEEDLRNDIRKHIEIYEKQINALLESSPQRLLHVEPNKTCSNSTREPLILKQNKFVTKINRIKKYWHSKVKDSSSDIEKRLSGDSQCSSESSLTDSENELSNDGNDNGNVSADMNVLRKLNNCHSEKTFTENLQQPDTEKEHKQDNESSSNDTSSATPCSCSPKRTEQNSTDSSSYLTAMDLDTLGDDSGGEVSFKKSVSDEKSFVTGLDSLCDADDFGETESVYSVGLTIDTASVISATETESILDVEDFASETDYSESRSDDGCDEKPYSVKQLEVLFDRAVDQYFFKHPFGFNERQQNEGRKEVAISFMKYLIRNKLISIGKQFSEEELERLYDTYTVHHSNEFVSKSQILVALKSINVIKRKGFADQNNNLVEFKEYVFLNYDEDLNDLNGLFKNKIRIHYLSSEEDLIFEKALFKCAMCRQACKDESELAEHNSSKIHILKRIYRQDRSWFSSEIKNLNVINVPRMTLDVNEQHNIEVSLENVSKEEYNIRVLNIFELVNLREIQTTYTSNDCIKKGEMFKLTMSVRFTQYGAKIFPVVLKLSENGSEEFRYLLIEPTFNVVCKNVPQTKPNQRFHRRPGLIKDLPEITQQKRCIIPDAPPPTNRRCIIPDARTAFSSNKKKPTLNRETKWGFGRKPVKCVAKEKEPKEVIQAPRIARELEVPKLHLPLHAIPAMLKKLLKFGFRTNAFKFDSMDAEMLKKIKKLICDADTNLLFPNEIALNVENYVDRFHVIMWMEEFQAFEEIKSYEQQNIILLTDRIEKNLLGINLPGLAEGRPSVLKGDTVLILPKGYVKKFEGNVYCVEESAIYVKINERFYNERLFKHPVNVQFQMNRTPLKMSHSALDKIKLFKMQSIMFPNSYEQGAKSTELKPFFNKSIEGNELQVQAIKNIVENRAYPAPYILFGPPGTGKTATLVEAIAQIWSVLDDSRICVCASSNTAADVIAARLLQYIPLTDIIRIYGLSRTDVNILPELKGCCNYDPGVKEVFFPSIRELSMKRVIVMTPVTAGRLVLSGISFDYLFMDEAGHTVEVDMLIPIVGFLKKSADRAQNGSLILAGDPKQLGPVVRSPTAIALGYGMSLLERLMKQCDLYQKDPVTLKYNEKVITKLVNNYRSHEKILHVSNLRFYDNELVAKGAEEKIACLSQWNKLPTANFPIIFHSVKGKEERESNSPSYFNVQEVNIVEQYVNNLFSSYKHEINESDIGIISPYKKQVLKIRQRLVRRWSKINVASVEEFQGQERKIIIISTVRSRHELLATDYKFGLGFLKNEKRFNVAITRAMALLVVIGNPDILQCDPNWRAFLEYCTENASFVGEPANGTVPADFDPSQESIIDLTGFKI